MAETGVERVWSKPKCIPLTANHIKRCTEDLLKVVRNGYGTNYTKQEVVVL